MDLLLRGKTGEYSYPYCIMMISMHRGTWQFWMRRIDDNRIH
jgi:hypothetical protein